MSNSDENQITFYGPGGTQLRLVFEKGNDRWSHRWEFGLDDDWQTLMTSQEGSPEQIWPASPPLQEVSRHELGETEALLAVGMAGKSHWSASYSIEPDCIKADLACLEKERSSTGQPGDSSLGSTYRINAKAQIDNDAVRIHLANQVVVVESICDSDIQSQLEILDQILIVKPLEKSKSPLTSTRWGFRLKIEESR